MRYAHTFCGWSKRLKPNESRRAFIRGAWLCFVASTSHAPRALLDEAIDRLASGSEIPSSFFFDDVEEARFYKLAQNIHTLILYEVELVDPTATQHRTDWRNISPSGNLDNDWTRRYWASIFQPPHQPTGRQCREVFAVTALKVIAALP
jgi:hypothetical protein